MGSVGSPKSWPSYDAYNDCAQGICNIYCPQWCTFPPPLDSNDDSGTTFSPLVIAVIGILASAFLLVSYYTIITKYCRRRRGRNPNLVAEEAHLDEVNRDQWHQAVTSGLDEGLIKSITVFKYNKGDGLVEGTECSVCLNEFQENENLRLLPKCCHAFHPSCIDTWLKSHSNCPMCRANAAPSFPLPNPSPNPPNSSTLHISALETQIQSDLVLVIEEDQEEEEEEEEEEEMVDHHQELVVNGCPDFVPKNSNPLDKKIPYQDESSKFRRSISLSDHNGLLVDDILRIREGDEEKEEEGIQQRSGMKIGFSRGIQEEQIKSINREMRAELWRSHTSSLKRSVSTGGFIYTRQD